MELGGADSDLKSQKSRPKAESAGEVLGEGEQAPSPPARGSGACWKLPSEVRAGAPAANAFLGIKSPGHACSGYKFR